jgi:hypothetical protein
MRQFNIQRYKIAIYVIAFLLTGIYFGCSDNSTTAPHAGNFALSVQKASPSPGSATGGDSLTFDTVKIMLKNVELFSDSGRFGEGEDHERSEEVEAGPFVVDLNLNGSVNTVALTNIPAGTYNGVKFEIHRIGRFETIPDSEFIDSTCGERGYSIIASGTYLGTHFIFKSRHSFNQRVLFPSPITVTENGFINVTLTVDPYSWFKFNGNYIDPNNPANYELINQLIRESFGHCFREGDWDGYHHHDH